MSVRRINRETALSAITTAAAALGVPAAELTAAGYRRFRGQPDRATTLPSDFTISLLFGGWHRAIEHAGPHRRPIDEDEARNTLYGQRSRVDRL